MALGQGYHGSCLDIFNINVFFVACFMYSYHNNLLPQGKKVNKPSTSPLIFLLFTVLINLDCKASCGLIRDGLFTN